MTRTCGTGVSWLKAHRLKIAMFLISICLGFAVSSVAMAQAVPLPKVDLTQAAKGKSVYLIKDGEFAVGGDLIKRVEVGKNTAVITYFNKTTDSGKPDYRFRLFNAYGLQVADFSDSWLLDTVSAGEAHTEKKDRMGTYNLDQIVQFSGISLPADWASPVYLIIEGKQP